MGIWALEDMVRDVRANTQTNIQANREDIRVDRLFAIIFKFSCDVWNVIGST